MSMQKVLVSVPPMRSEPRGALFVAQALTWLMRFAEQMRAVAVAASEASRQRAAAERESRNRADLLAMALRYQGSQPEFAKDLVAAAWNHRPD